MSNYEIFILTKSDMPEENLKKILTTTLKLSDIKLEKLERTELSYPIKKQTHGNYYLTLVKIGSEHISELVRKLNINKQILRYLVINRDTEKGIKPRRRTNKYVEKVNKMKNAAFQKNNQQQQRPTQPSQNTNPEVKTHKPVEESTTKPSEVKETKKEVKTEEKVDKKKTTKTTKIEKEQK
ncbi:30S ribosomal protein S6 [Metamycoplasma hyosynoviae]|uniref:30S ribosomal protein S6 n=1 Tax=Metamycoplasma hyosynoviae TaxID=29559 RepID=UPI002366900E|nr:30S ribosomal protein S6 [Metamycoplasma hyosynoviae]MDD7907908.1 30S ribosomal protein S6 [Metamycoplasma hyosynoviae]